MLEERPNKRNSPPWLGLPLVVLACLATSSLWTGLKADHKALHYREIASRHLGELDVFKQRQLSSLKERLAQDEKTSADLEVTLNEATLKLKITQGQLKVARRESTKLNDETEEKLSALDTSVHSELATKATSDDVTTLSTKVGGLQTELNSAKEDLRMAQSEMGTLIARNNDEIQQLRKMELPRFPVQPPRWTMHMKIPDALVVKDGTGTLGAAYKRILEALHRAHIAEFTLYAFGDDGFAVVCRMEAIDKNGAVLPGPARYSTEPQPVSLWNLGLYRDALLLANVGRYRVIVLVVTPQSFGPNKTETTPAEMHELLQVASNLSDEMGNKIMTPNTRCEALIYEFVKRGSSEARFTDNSSLSPAQNLAMFWDPVQLE